MEGEKHLFDIYLKDIYLRDIWQKYSLFFRFLVDLL